MTNTDDTNKMLRVIINGQATLKSELVKEFRKEFGRLDKKIDKVEENLAHRMDRMESRLDKIGRAVAYLEDDAPTREEFDKLEKRVGKVEQKLTPASN